MKLSSDCMYCLVQRQAEHIKDFLDEEKKSRYMREVLSIIANAHETFTAPVVLSEINKLHQRYWNESYQFENLKYDFNKLMMQKEKSIMGQINCSDDKLLTAIKYARIGNYIDFGAMKQIDNQKLESLLERVHTEDINLNIYHDFLTNLEHSKNLVFLTDNCGEIVLDKILIQVIKKEYPHISMNVIVRGKPILNDATFEDAEMVGLTEIVPVFGNGTEIAGTQLDRINPSVKQLMMNADIIISKGQGNFETLNGCGLNIYYLFICKCDWFVRQFHLEKFKGVFTSELTLNQI